MFYLFKSDGKCANIPRPHHYNSSKHARIGSMLVATAL